MIVIELNPWYFLWAWVVGSYAFSALYILHNLQSIVEELRLVISPPIAGPFKARSPRWVRLGLWALPIYAAPVYWVPILLLCLGILVCPWGMTWAAEKLFDILCNRSQSFSDRYGIIEE